MLVLIKINYCNTHATIITEKSHRP